jgi:hypothetical protein
MRWSLLAGAAFAWAAMANAQDAEEASYEAPTKPFAVDESYLSGLEWRNIGP